ncbi:hypothetical protein BO70DRAFT_275510, partial [Aspergillus heteromorphus CBS 117.55]
PSTTSLKTCDQVRAEIRAFIASGAMKPADFQRAIGVSVRSYTEFLNQQGERKGARSATFLAARGFFGVPVPVPVPVPAAVPAAVSAAPATAPPAKRAKKNTAAAAGPNFDVSEIHLDGEETMQVPVFDTCDVVRRKIKAHIRKQGVTQARFLREIARAAIPETGKKLKSKSLADFLSYKGPTTGSGGMTFYAAYVFFEKLRVRDGKPKNDFRLEMEKVWPRGFERETNAANGRMFCGPGEMPIVDRYGRV